MDNNTIAEANLIKHYDATGQAFLTAFVAFCTRLLLFFLLMIPSEIIQFSDNRPWAFVFSMWVGFFFGVTWAISHLYKKLAPQNEFKSGYIQFLIIYMALTFITDYIQAFAAGDGSAIVLLFIPQLTGSILLAVMGSWMLSRNKKVLFYSSALVVVCAVSTFFIFSRSW